MKLNLPLLSLVLFSAGTYTALAQLTSSPSAAIKPIEPFSFAPSATALRFDASPSSSSARPAVVAEESMPEAPSAIHGMVRVIRPPLAVASHTQPFSTLAIGLTFGTGGVGVEVATPINSRFNLRGGVGFFNYTTSFTADSVPIDGTLHLGNIHAGVDWFLFAHKTFHISPGVTMFNHSNYNAKIYIAGNQIITLNDQDYTSDPADPIHGTALIQFGSTFSPRLTAGFGNMIPHKDKNWSFPMEFGFQYIKKPTAVFGLAGSSCDNLGDCEPIQGQPDTQTNILEEQNEIVHDLAPLRFFPVVQFGGGV